MGGGLKREGIYVYLELIHVEQQKPTQYCKAIILQFKKKLRFHLHSPIPLLVSTGFDFRKKVKVKSLSRVQHFATPWTVAHLAPLSRGFSRQEYWNGLPFPSPGVLPNTGIKSGSLALPAHSLPLEPLRKSLFVMGGEIKN